MALAAVSVLAVAVPAVRLLRPAPAPELDAPTWADATYGALRDRLRPGERVGVVVAEPDPNRAGAFSYAAQYALAPAVVQPLLLVDCVRPGRGPGCPLEGVRLVAVAAEDPALVSLVRSLGLEPVGPVGGVLLLERR